MGTDTRVMTLAEYAALEEPDDAFVSELVRGVLVREPRPGRVHGLIQIRIGSALERWARAMAAEVTAGSGYVLAEDPPTLRGPDIGVVLEPRSTEGVPGGWVRGAPDVVVEVLSPSDASTTMQQKVLDYLGAGARWVWIVDPLARTVTVYRPDGSAQVLGDVDTLAGEDVLNGFEIELAELFG